MSKPIYEGSITNVHGIRVGQAENRAALTGVTVVLCGRDGATVGADVRGAAPGTRETDALKSESTVETLHAVVLSGGSAFGFLDGPLDDVGGNLGGFRLLDRPLEGLVHVRIGNPGFRRDIDFLAEAGIDFGFSGAGFGHRGFSDFECTSHG